MMLISVQVYAQEAPAYAPWMDISFQQEEIVPKKLTLKDLETLDEQPRIEEPVKASRIEELYANRIVDELQQYGYDMFSDIDEDDVTSIPSGMIQDDYVLSVGDQLTVTLRGQVNTRQVYEIDRQGFLTIDDLPPIVAAGRSLKTVKQELSGEVQNLHNTQIYLTLSGVRQIGVLVVGHVKRPGRKNLTAFHNVFDALNLSGGVDKTGSLRQIKLIRQGKSHYVDLYQLLMISGGRADMLLKDGDRIVVPPLGATMAVSGYVKRPGIYEIRRNEKLSLHQVLNLAGGTMTPGESRYLRFNYDGNGEETVLDVKVGHERVFGDGSILVVSPSEKKRSEVVNLEGHTRQPGMHDLKKAKTLGDLIHNEKVLGKDIYPLIGVIERYNEKHLSKEFIAFSPTAVLNKKDNQPLKNNDVVHLFSKEQILQLSSHDEQEEEDQIDDPVLISFLKERSSFVRGAVRKEGAYPVADNVDLNQIIAVAGGMALEGNKDSIEVTSRGGVRNVVSLNNQSDVMVRAGDTVRVNQKFHKIVKQTVTLIGEVNHPGEYDLVSGDTLMTLLERAGGLTDQAYPDGAIFSRAAERKREESRYKAQAQDLELKLAASLQQVDDDKKPDMGQVSATQSLIARLNNAKAVGRITVEADPLVLQSDPEQNILLEHGDKIFIPKRPLTVRVAGEVLSPAALQFRSGKDPLTYIHEAGGTTYYADKERSFVIYPDGSAQPLKVSAWNHEATLVPPGSTIIVPRDPKPFNFLESAEHVSQILANLAISGLYIDAIGDDD